MSNSGLAWRWKYSWLICGGYALLLVFYWWAYARFPLFHAAYLRGEDKAVEWLTFIGFIMASFILFRSLRFRKSMSKWAVCYVLGLGLFFGVCAGEEISWGQRIIGFKTPETIVGANEQHEFNLHNMSFKHIHPAAMVSLFMKIFGIALPVACFKWTRQSDSRLSLYILPVQIAPLFVFGEVLSTVQRQIKPWLVSVYGEDVSLVVRLDTAEFKEMYWGLSVLAASYALYLAWRRSVETV